MKRYFHTTVKPGSVHVGSAYHYLNLPNGEFVVVMFQEEFDPDPAWTELPHLLEKASPSQAIAAAINGLVPVVATDQTFHIAKKLSVHNPHFHP